MTGCRAASGISVSERMTVWPLLCEDVTFLTGKAVRTASLMWLSHMPHIMPSIFSVI